MKTINSNWLFIWNDDYTDLIPAVINFIEQNTGLRINSTVEEVLQRKYNAILENQRFIIFQSEKDKILFLLKYS